MTVLTAPQRSEAARRYAEGASLQELITSFGSSYKHVRNAIMAEGVPIRPMGATRPRPAPPSPVPQRLPQLELEVATKLYKRGKTVRQVAALIGYSRSTVHKALREAGVKMRPLSASRASRITPAKRQAILAAWGQGKSASMITKEVGAGWSTVIKVLKAEKLDPSAHVHRLDHDRMRALRAQRWTLAAIAADQGTRYQYVWNVLDGQQKCCSIPGACQARLKDGRQLARLARRDVKPSG
ncbi:hypothetical protein [Streptosporangium sp. NPDC002524]|uniref:helix-turn-helix domain-containing protein n=1 Tax=Streptosporangium sp. NPDC002524 TaxID=3154537 RepID=UPI00331B030E